MGLLERIPHIPMSAPMGSVFGIPIRLHMMFLMVLGMQLMGAMYYGGQYVFLWFILLGPVLLLTVLVHELGHCLAARSVGGEVSGILLWPLGGMAFVGHTAGPKADMWVAVAGPLTHVPMLGVWLLLLLPAFHATAGSWAINLAMPYPSWGWAMWRAICVGAIWMNITLFAFNLLVPAYPLDGGRLLVDGLLAMGVEPRRTAIITVCVALPLAGGILAWGIIVFQMVTIMVAVFILWSVFQLIQAIRNDTLAQHPLFATSSGPEDTGPYFKFNSGGV
ncbi:hypothetical protein HYH03_011840 [Edaphochlamys debaryana]|uniref:Peptidase M50 domain-containing protein n=1 Tax=Edaphochlamys debaryana TaxID=47281 RepID=A0A836BW40_9CHLO|nr:hypothetical protein HYH03_011840 [Edaphochlamys debaryana]|eukprot:KAG2489733.1 hypothetical protein HYH03_011840 [Edaphochlamys debaryana]